MINKKIAVIGAGGWGTALACTLAKKSDILLWCFEPEAVDEILMNRTNSGFLPNVELPDNIIPTSDLSQIQDIDIIVNTVPTQFIRSIYSQIKFSLNNKIIINGSKGIEKGSLKRIYEIFNETVDIKPANYVSLSGPSHAEEVVKDVPTAVVAASTNFDLVKNVRELLTTDLFRVYSSPDVIGCELGGALKNVIAIAYGVVQSMNYGDNTKATVITRGLAEMSRLGTACGANPHTFSGLSGLGDLVVTCTSKHSRNRAVGELLAQGLSMEEIKLKNKMVAEGVETAQSALDLANKISIEMPITQQVYNAIYKFVNVKECIYSLMARESKDELW